jgi:hypothetical protein
MRCLEQPAQELSTICRTCEEQLTRARAVAREEFRNLAGAQRVLKPLRAS